MTCVSHVADAYKRYPGELVHFHTRVAVDHLRGDSVLSVFLPQALELVDYQPAAGSAGASGADGAPVASVVVRDTPDGVWIDRCLEPLPQESAHSAALEWVTCVRVRPAEYNLYAASAAVLRDSQGETVGEERAAVAVRSQAAYMQYLPEIYHGDDLMNRLLMLAESFWQPIDGQIQQPDVYYDPGLAPEDFLDWLASWIGVPVDQRIPQERKRKLLGAALSLYQRYGTRSALVEFLRLYTGGEVEIYEHRAENFVLGQRAQLGLTMALGQQNFPHTFTVKLTVRRQDMLDFFGGQPVNAEKLYRQRIEAIIEAQKPAHTAFNLNLQIVDAPN